VPQTIMLPATLGVYVLLSYDFVREFLRKRYENRDTKVVARLGGGISGSWYCHMDEILDRPFFRNNDKQKRIT